MYHEIRWTAEKIAQRIKLIEPLVYRHLQKLPPFRLHLEPDTEPGAPLVKPNIDDHDWPIVQPYTYWGAWQANFTLRTTFQCPAGWQPDTPAALYLPIGKAKDFSHPEALVYLDGVPYAACDRHHQEIRLPEHLLDGRPHLLVLHGWTGLGSMPAPPEHTQLLMRPCALVQLDQPLREFIVTARVALGAATALDDGQPAKHHLLNALDEAFKILDTREPLDDALYNSVPAAHEALQTGIATAGPALDVTVAATGHAHIDVAWLWTLAQTRRKCKRTFHTMLRLMEEFPAYHFTQSQPQLYEFVRQDDPALFEAIKTRAAEGRWEPIGGMWVEADCNLSGPESLARQFLLGRRFFRQHFGPDAESPVLWLPDVFGYAWNLPQLIKQAGLEYFFTIKIGWNQYNRLPYDTFWWQGLDGTKVLTHFSPTPDALGNGVSTYNSTATPEQNLGSWTNLQQKETQQDVLMVYGYGDGGGGPTREMLENIEAMADFPAVPRMRQMAVGEFFRRLEETCGPRLPTWNGELYLELHRGTYTTQSHNKRANRKSEFHLHDAEFLASLALTADPTYEYPVAALRKAWELVCLNQFHDIIPGSSIRQVYIDSRIQYEEVEQIGESVKLEALAVIGRHSNADLLLLNPTGFVQTSPAFWPDHLPADSGLLTTDGKPVITQKTCDGTLLDPPSLPPLSVTALYRTDDPVDCEADTDNFVGIAPNFLENKFLYVELNEAGDITRIFDKRNQREVLPGGKVANQFLAFEDRPKRWDAWDLDISYEDTYWRSDPASAVTVVEEGPLRVTLEITRRILHSDYTQRISLYYNQPQIYFDTTITWSERHILLKVAFPVAVLSPTATYEIQWGNVERPTHHNTSWDWARFETCAQKWVDLSEGDYGVSLLNDCKYGHDIRDNVIRLSLLRGTTSPDPQADQGEHRFAYSLLPHAGRWDEQTIAAAYALNDPVLVSSVKRAPDVAPPASSISEQPLVVADRSNIVIETIKRAEDGDGLIVRFYESQRQRGEVTLTTNFRIARAERVNLIEDHQAGLTTDGQHLSLFVMPYQIVSVRLVPEQLNSFR